VQRIIHRFPLSDKVLKASEFIAVVRWAEVVVLLIVVLSFTAVFFVCRRRLVRQYANIVQFFKFKKYRLPTEVQTIASHYHVSLHTIFAPFCEASAGRVRKEERPFQTCRHCRSGLFLIHPSHCLRSHARALLVSAFPAGRLHS
jgi:hypothetical protein